MSLFSGFLSCAASYILLCAALLTPPSTLSHSRLAIVFWPLILSCCFYSWQCGLGVLSAPQALWSTNLLVFRHPRESFQLLYRHDGRGEAYPEPFSARFWWVIKLLVSPRFVGWSTGDYVKPGVLQYPIGAGSRRYWLRNKCIGAALYLLVIDAANCYMLYDPYFLGRTNIDSPLPEYFTKYLIQSWVPLIPSRLPRIVVFGLQQYAIFSLLGTIIAIICYFLGWVGLLVDFWGAIYNWPPIMGSPLVVLERGLRGFWGTFWHQLFRHMFVDPGKAFARVLVPARSPKYYAVQVIFAFWLSGAFHAATLPRDLEDFSMLRYASFFWLQGLCVLLEIFVSYSTQPSDEPGARPSWPNSRRIVRLLWTMGVLYTTVPIIEGELVKMSAKMGRRPVLLFSVPRKEEL